MMIRVSKPSPHPLLPHPLLPYPLADVHGAAMRLIHTSDWHLGRTLHGESLLEHQAGFLEWLLAQAVSQHADAVVVAGDVYDRAVPSTDAVTLLDGALTAFARQRIPVAYPATGGTANLAINVRF